MNKAKAIIISLVFALPVTVAVPASVGAQTDTTRKIFEACAQAPDSPVCKGQTENENPVVRVIRIAANLIAAIAGIAAVVMVILGGLSYITAGGNAEMAANARRRITYALIGVIVIALAWAITRFITDRVIQ